MRNYEQETERRVAFIRSVVEAAGAEGIVFGNSGGKDSALAGALCKRACENTVGVLLPCGARRNFQEDQDDALAVAAAFGIESRTVDLTPTKDSIITALEPVTPLTRAATVNLVPRLRMAALYAVAASENRLVCGTGNRSEIYVGYFTKWGDGACDLNPISDLTVTEIYEFLHYLKTPESILTKAPSAALYDGQTDENDMGFLYKDLDRYLITGQTDESLLKSRVERLHRHSEHKRVPVPTYREPGSKQ